MGYTQVCDIVEKLLISSKLLSCLLQATQFFGENFCVSPLDFNGKTMNEMLHR